MNKLVAMGVMMAAGAGLTTGAVGAAEAPVVPQPDGGAAATAPIVVSPPQATLVTEQEMFGSGPSGSGNELPDCAALTYFDWNTGTCAPTSSPAPQGTVPLSYDAACPVQGDLETAFTTPGEMRTLVECILPVAEEWLSWEYAGLTPAPEWQSLSSTLLPNNILYVPTGVSVESDENCGGYSDADLAYCMIDGNIYLGEAALWRDYNQHGDADIWGTISHELGHRVQHVANRRLPATENEKIPAENQADCFSGAFLDYAARHRYIDSAATGDDLFDLFVGLFNIGEQVGDDQSHGTIDQRIRAFFVGYNSSDSSGVFDCAFYLTDVSIIPPQFQTQG